MPINIKDLQNRDFVNSEVLITRHLMKLPNDTVLTTSELAELSGVSSSGVRLVYNKLKSHSFKVGPHRIWWGNPKAIAALRKRFENQRNS